MSCRPSASTRPPGRSGRLPSRRRPRRARRPRPAGQRAQREGGCGRSWARSAARCSSACPRRWRRYRNRPRRVLAGTSPRLHRQPTRRTQPRAGVNGRPGVGSAPPRTAPRDRSACIHRSGAPASPAPLGPFGPRRPSAPRTVGDRRRNRWTAWFDRRPAGWVARDRWIQHRPLRSGRSGHGGPCTRTVGDRRRTAGRLGSTVDPRIGSRGIGGTSIVRSARAVRATEALGAPHRR